MSIDSDQRSSVAVIGCGYWGKNLVRVFAELGALRAVVDPDAATAAAMAERYGVTALTMAEVAADASIDAAAIAAPAAEHHRVARELLAAGKHVFVEKPLALDLDDAVELDTLARQRDLTLMVGHLLHYHPAFLALRDLVSRGELGALQYMYSNRLNLGKFRREENILWSFAPHDISMILALAGSEPDHVSAVGSAHLSPTVADVTTTHLSFPSGERAHVFVSWLHPYKEQKLVIVGADGMAVFDDGEPWETKLQMWTQHVDWRDGLPHPVKETATPVGLTPSEPLRNECEHFLDCVRTGATPRTDGREGLRVLRVLRAAQDSLSAGALT